MSSMPAYIPRHLFSALQGPPVTVGDYIDAYLVGYGDWHGAVAEYPQRCDTNRTTEASNMAYALHELRNTVSVEPDGTPREVRHLPLADLRPGDLRACQAHMIERGLCRNEVNKRKNKIQSWVRWLVEFEHADDSIIRRLEVVRPVKAGRPGVRLSEVVEDVDPADVEATLRAASPPLRRAIITQCKAGMRPGELLAMRVCYIHPHRASGGWMFRPHWTKTQLKLGFKREIPLGPLVQAELREQVSTLGHELGLFGSTVPKIGDDTDRRHIWPWKTVNGYYQAVKRAAKRARVAHWSPNQLRHSTLTEAANVAGIETAASIGGHMNPTTTRKHYFHGHAEKARLWAEEHG